MRPVLIAAVLLVSACSAQPAPASNAPAVAGELSPPSHEAREWREPSAYSFTLASECGERSLIGRFHIEVENGVVVGVEGLDEQGRRFVESRSSEGRRTGGVPTLAGLLGQVAEARRDGADRVEVKADQTDGHPVSIAIDRRINATDDEECYEISAFSAR